MTTFALQRRLQGVSITVSAQEPGYVKTELNRGWSDKSILSLFNNIGYASTYIIPSPEEYVEHHSLLNLPWVYHLWPVKEGVG